MLPLLKLLLLTFLIMNSKAEKEKGTGVNIPPFPKSISQSVSVLKMVATNAFFWHKVPEISLACFI